MLHAYLDIPMNRNVKFFPSSKSKRLLIDLFCLLRSQVMCEHWKRNNSSLWPVYKRCIFCFWPQTHGQARNFLNAKATHLFMTCWIVLVYLRLEKTAQIMRDLEEDEDESDTSQNVTSPASTTESPKRSQNDIRRATEPRSGDLSASPPRSASQQQLCSDGSANRLIAQPWQDRMGDLKVSSTCLC